MTNDQLEGRDLDRACAEAMGWTQLRLEYVKPRPSSGVCGGGGHLGYDEVAPSLLGNPADGSSPYPCARHVPRYSTDPGTQAEKLLWLHANWALCVIIGHYTEKVGACAASPVAQNLHAEGTTIDEALARLVCAVAKAKKEQNS